MSHNNFLLSLSYMFKNKLIQTATILTLFAILGAGLVTLSYSVTRDQIAHNEKMVLLRNLNALVPAEDYDNDLFSDTTVVRDPLLLEHKETAMIYRARKEGQPVATIFDTLAPDGYNGKIQLLVGINVEGIILGVRIVSHQETPGLGDLIDIPRSNWVLGFNGHSLTNPTSDKWRVKRDGGIFDQFTGATITPRAVVKAVHRALLLYDKHQKELFITTNENLKTTGKTTDKSP